jgi:hypothetical protein
MQRLESRVVIVVLCVLASWASASAQVNDNCPGAIALAAGANGPFSNAAATNSATLASCGAGGYKDIWYKFTTAAQGSLTVSTGCGGFDTILTAYGSCGGAELACNDDTPGCGYGGSTIAFPVIGASTYYFRVASYSAGTSGSFTVTVAFSLANDDCAGAIALSYGPNGPFSNVGASNGGVVAGCSNSPGYRDVWFYLVTAAAGTVTVSTGCGGLDTILTAYDACGGTLLACQDDTVGCGSGGSTISFLATATSTYYFRVASYWSSGSGSSGSFNITVTIAFPPANDECAGAIPLSYGPNGPFANAGATDGGAVASCGGGGHKDVWFSIVATCPGLLSVRAVCTGSGFDTVLTGYAACGGTQLGCSSHQGFVGCGTGSLITFPVTAGATYYVRVASADLQNSGTFTIDVAPAAQVGLVFTSPLGPGSLKIDLFSRQSSGSYFMAVTFNAGSYPSGWFYGIDIPWPELIGEINGGYPFYGTLGSCGETTIGPFAGLGAVAGLPFYAVAFATQAGGAVPDVSAPVTASIP